MITKINDIQTELMHKVEVRPYNKDNRKDGNFNFIHQEYVADAFIKIRNLIKDFLPKKNSSIIAWFKHGPYDVDEEIKCVFENPNDDICYTALVPYDELARFEDDAIMYRNNWKQTETEFGRVREDLKKVKVERDTLKSDKWLYNRVCFQLGIEDNIISHVTNLQTENAQLKEDVQVLTDCLNGSSKAIYTAEMYDKLREENYLLKGDLEQAKCGYHNFGSDERMKEQARTEAGKELINEFNDMPFFIIQAIKQHFNIKEN